MTAGGPDIEGVGVDEMREYLSETDVVFAVLFGSRAVDDAEGSSDVDVALRFPGRLTARERFRRRNRIDAELQAYADAFVDVSDIETLPTPVAYAAVRDGVLVVGDEDEFTRYRERIGREYESAADERERERSGFLRRLIDGSA